MIQTNPTRFLSSSLLLVLIGLAACSNPRGRIMGGGEQDIVGSNRAGAATYDRLIAGAVDRILSSHSGARGAGSDRLQVVVLEVENKGLEELVDWRAQIYDLITTSINRSRRYSMVSKRFVEAVLREARLTADDLYIPAKRRQLAQLLERQGTPVDAILFPSLTTGSTAGEGSSQRNYLLTLELVDVGSGWSDQVSERIRKQYD